MMAKEKEQLLTLFDDERRWCQDVEALDADGNAVHYSDDAAVAWDITGALCRLFGLQRACVLFEQLDRHINGKRLVFGWPPPDTAMVAMGALQDFNDRVDMTFESIRVQLEAIPVWVWSARRGGAVSKNEDATTVQP